MPKLSANSVTMLDGAVVLSRRNGTAKWQARFKNGAQWIRVTTKEKDLEKAKKTAREIYLETQFRVKHGIPAQSKRFKDVARLAVDRMKKAIAGGEGRRVYRDYIQAIDNYLIPFFGNHHIDHVTYPMLQQFASWRNEKLGKEPKSSTINTHNSALNRVFDEALMHGYIEPQLAAMKSDGATVVIIQPGPFTHRYRQRIFQGATSIKCATIYGFPPVAQDGALIAYGPDAIEMYHAAGQYAARIVKGEKTAELPVQQPTHFQLVINLATAKTLGLKLPPTLLARADEVIE